MRYRLFINAIVGCVAFGAAGCQLHTAPAEPSDLPLSPALSPSPYSLSEMRVQLIRGTPFLFVPLRTNFNEMASRTAPAISGIAHLPNGVLAERPGRMLFVYHDPPEDPSRPFDMEAGVAARSATPLGLFQARTLPAFRCATMLYRGPVNLLDKAYDTLIREMIDRGFVPSEETRENYLLWDGPQSAKNIVQIQVGNPLTAISWPGLGRSSADDDRPEAQA